MKIAVFISGRGSNLQALIETCQDPAVPAQIGLVISNRPGAQGLKRAAAAGIATAVIDHTTYDSREAFDAALDSATRRAGCAICTASTSLMTESVKGKTVEQAKDLFDEFHDMLTGVAAEQGLELGKLQVFEGVREYPVRVKCATLAWHTLNAAMKGEEKVTTE